MILGFKDQFVPFVEDGSKTHSIRDGERWKVGMRADCFARPRQKDMRLLFRAPVVRVGKIAIYEYQAVQSGRGPIPPLEGNHCPGACRGPNGESLLVWIDDIRLAADAARRLFERDGFRDVGFCPMYQALLFWGRSLPFHGQLIHWDYRGRWIGGANWRPETRIMLEVTK